MLGSSPLASRPLTTSARLPRPFAVAPMSGEYGYAAWSFSRQAKLNAWGWHGVGNLGNVMAWATLGNAIYLRDDVDTAVHVLQPDTFLADTDTNAESTSVLATTQWLDMGKPTQTKALDGFDFDCVGIQAVNVYIPVDGDRAGTLAASVPVSTADGGWTYNGQVIPVGIAATAFKLEFIGAPNTECQVNRLTLHYSELQE
jgi:hypothetical protein